MAKKNTRDLILDVASTVFATIGLRRTTMETIASAAGRGRRTVYMYFKNKAEIYNAVVEREIGFITLPLRDVISSDGPWEETLYRYATVRREQISTLLDRNPLLLKDFSLSHYRVERLREKLFERELRIVTPFFGEIVNGMNIKVIAEPGYLAISFLNLLRGNDRILAFPGSHEKAAALSDIAALLIINSIRKTPGQ